MAVGNKISNMLRGVQNEARGTGMGHREWLLVTLHLSMQDRHAQATPALDDRNCRQAADAGKR